jgi:hypothetical protein
MASKVSADLKRMQRFYGLPSDSKIANFETELVAYLKAGYLDTVAYGYKREGAWINPTLRYTAQDLAGGDANDDDPGRVRPGANVANASFYSYLTRNSHWDALSSERRAAFEATLPINRPGASAPDVNGYFSPDRTYSAGGRALNRDSVRSW